MLPQNRYRQINCVFTFSYLCFFFFSHTKKLTLENFHSRKSTTHWYTRHVFESLSKKRNKRWLSLVWWWWGASEWWSWGSRGSIQTPAHHNSNTMHFLFFRSHSSFLMFFSVLLTITALWCTFNKSLLILGKAKVQNIHN